MFAISIEPIRCDPARDHRPDAHPHLFDKHDVCRQGNPPLQLRERHMRVKLWARRLYAPRDLADHCDADLRLCTSCKGENNASCDEDPRKVERSRKCATIPKFHLPARPSVARFATANSDWSGAIPGGPRCVQGSALIASGPAGDVIVAGYAGSGQLEHHASNSRRLESLGSEEIAL